MRCALDEELLKLVVEFHGHDCPGLWIGIRAAELCLQRLGRHDDNDPLLAITETDMCAVDAIQALLGCTFGKGNLIHRDYGKVAFSFYRRNNGRAFRAVRRAESGGGSDEMRELMRLVFSGKATDEQKQRYMELRDRSRAAIIEADLEDLFDVLELHDTPPRPARILDSLRCESCGEMTMESRTRRFGGKTLCIPCFGAVEQKM